MDPDEPIIESPVIAELVEPPRLRPWGFWATMGFSLAVIGALVLLQTVVAVAFIVQKVAASSGVTQADIEALKTNGLLFSLSVWASMPLCTLLVVGLVKLRRQLSVRQYLSLNQVSVGTYVLWTVIMLVYIVGADLASWVMAGRVVPEVMVQAYRTAVFPPLLWAAIVILAPIFEELFFRGFFFRGIQESRLGNTGAILITAFFWSIIHVQYDLPQIISIFIIGILFGIARASTNSTYPTIMLHFILNLIATIQVEIALWK